MYFTDKCLYEKSTAHLVKPDLESFLVDCQRFFACHFLPGVRHKVDTERDFFGWKINQDFTI